MSRNQEKLFIGTDSLTIFFKSFYVIINQLMIFNERGLLMQQVIKDLFNVVPLSSIVRRGSKKRSGCLYCHLGRFIHISQLDQLKELMKNLRLAETANHLPTLIREAGQLETI
ncbi:hypothetical protein [Virgibacillus pantothenticus]|uniref:hypothetical protein n=1 Tax=Virgibacillus pantothenticus TaxID=1473 RepID=UPI001BAEC046|nr:hypothetical protein [Virgibacillus pantothenticus]